MSLRFFPLPEPSASHPLVNRSSVVKLAAYSNGLLLDVDARDLINSDTSTVTTWYDRTLTGPGISGGTATMSTTGWTTDGGPCVSFVAASNQYEACDPVAASINGGDFSVAVLFRRSTAGVYHTIFSLGTTASAYRPFWQLFVSDANVIGAQVVSGNSSSALLATTIPAKTTEDTLALFSWVASTRQLTVYCNGQRSTLDFSAVTGLTAATNARLGSLWNGAPSNGLNGKVRALAVWNRALGDADWRAVVARWGCAYLHRYRVIIAGNSIDAGFDGSADNDPVQNWFYPPAQAVVSNTAHDGWQASQILADFPTHVAPLVADGAPWVYIVGDIRNSIYYGGTAQSAVSDLLACCDNARAHGGFVVVHSPIDCTQWGAIGNSVGNALLAQALPLLRAQWQGHADAFVDLNAIKNLSNSTDLNYFADGIHPTTAGQRIRGAAMWAAIQSLAATALDALVLTA